MNLAIIGCGGIGRMHAEMAARCGLKIVACADKDPDAAKALARRYNALATTDADGAIRRPDVDIVLVTTPTPRHAGVVIDAAKAGKHIFCEKPFASTVQQGRTAIAAVKKARVKLFVGHVVRYFHEFETLRAQIQAGKIGEPGYVKMYRGGIYPGGPSSWFRDYAQSGGVTFDCMIHDLDWLRYMFGEPDRIFCQALRRSEPEKLDYSQVTLKMRNGMLAL
ncbi:MAG TPA: Gfo/Idh/MocA family oxidoreductase, partial [Candidatus Hydrogenedentes bacterium]|nr:Gfo/Idh/MocA family oxidoreductase [Candidatus Hydrogenedentota bacterium]